VTEVVVTFDVDSMGGWSAVSHLPPFLNDDINSNPQKQKDVNPVCRHSKSSLPGLRCGRAGTEPLGLGYDTAEIADYFLTWPDAACWSVGWGRAPNTLFS